MTKLCPRGKAAAKRKFKVYPSAYAKDPSGKKRKDFKGPKPSGKAMGGVIDFNKIAQGRKAVSFASKGKFFNKNGKRANIAAGCGAVMASKRKETKRA
jgi:hypothetical protein